MNREQIDKIAWQSIHSRPARPPEEQVRSSRATNYRELGERMKAGVDFEHAWSDFLHAFYDYRTASFFTEPPPDELSRGWQVILAGSAEWLSSEFNLHHPAWTDDPRYFLDKPWDPLEDFGLDMSARIEDTVTGDVDIFTIPKRCIADQ